MKPLADIKYVVFDWDNTLVETSDNLKNVMDQAINHLVTQGVSFKTNFRPGYWNYPLRELLNLPSQELLFQSKAVYNTFLERSSSSKVVVFEGVVDLLKLLQNLQKELFIISNKREAVLHNQVKESGVLKFFESVVGSCEKTGIQKPSVDVFLRAFGKRVSPDNVLFIGDSSLDEETARNFGCSFIYVISQNFAPDETKKEQRVAFYELITCFKNGYLPVEYIKFNRPIK